MSKIGVIFCAWQIEEYVNRSLQAWIEAQNKRLAGNEFIICAISVPFKGFSQDNNLDRTLPILQEAVERQNIDHLITSNQPMKETEVRTAALKWLINQGVDTILQVDADEIYTEDNIDSIFKFVASHPSTPCFKLSLKNYIINEKTYLKEAFQPPRIHRVKFDRLVADSFWADNDITYVNRFMGIIVWKSVKDKKLLFETIPPSVAWVSHYTWMNNLRSKRKVAYQLERGWDCSFAWDDAKGGLIINQEYYVVKGLPLPNVVIEE